MNYLDLSPEYIARVTAILTKPMTALEFADIFWPNRVKRKPGIRSRAGHALLNPLVRQGLVRRKENKKGTPDTFVLASAQHADSTYLIDGPPDMNTPHAHTDNTCYWVLIWREKGEWGWLKLLDGSITQHPGERLRASTRATAMVALWTFRQEHPERGENLRAVRVSRTPAKEYASASGLQTPIVKLLKSLGTRQVSIVVTTKKQS